MGRLRESNAARMSNKNDINDMRYVVVEWFLTLMSLDVRPSRLVTVGDRSFGSVGPKLCNSLPDDITSASSLSVFRKKLKTHLFQQSYPDIIL